MTKKLFFNQIGRADEEKINKNYDKNRLGQPGKKCVPYNIARVFTWRRIEQEEDVHSEDGAAATLIISETSKRCAIPTYLLIDGWLR